MPVHRSQKGWWYAWPEHSYLPIGVLGLGLPFVYSPNLVWFAIALAMYVVFPYDMEAAAVWEPSFVAQRVRTFCDFRRFPSRFPLPDSR